MPASSARLFLPVALTLLAAAGGARAESAADCPGKPAGGGVVAAVLDGATVRLADGKVVRLAGVEPPSQHREGLDEKAAAALEGLVRGKRVELRHAAAKPDRYGRTVAQLFLEGPGGGWVEERLVAEGLSRVYPGADSRACTAALLLVERQARAERLGLWAEPAFAVRKAEDAALRHVKDVYALVEGRILSVGRSPATLYLDFGRDWSTDFTVTIPAKLAADFEAAGKGSAALRGREVRVRGWVTEWNGASMRLDHPEEIELIDRRAEGGAGE